MPGSTDLPWLGLLARSGYRALLDAGVRVFEWNGPMLHAKTAVIDGHWARVGSSNLNPASWLGNYELDAAIECVDFAAKMETQFLTDLHSATEIVLRPDQSVRLAQPRRRQRRDMLHQQSAVSTLRVSRAMALAVRESRRLGPADATLLMLLGMMGLTVAKRFDLIAAAMEMSQAGVATQVEAAPPTIVISTSAPRSVSEPYKRYLLNTFREALPFHEVPLRLLLRGKSAEPKAD